MILDGGSRAQLKTCGGGLLVCNLRGRLAKGDVLHFRITSDDLFTLAEALKRREQRGKKK